MGVQAFVRGIKRYLELLVSRLNATRGDGHRLSCTIRTYEHDTKGQQERNSEWYRYVWTLLIVHGRIGSRRETCNKFWWKRTFRSAVGIGNEPHRFVPVSSRLQARIQREKSPLRRPDVKLDTWFRESKLARPDVEAFYRGWLEYNRWTFISWSHSRIPKMIIIQYNLNYISRILRIIVIMETCLCKLQFEFRFVGFDHFCKV